MSYRILFLGLVLVMMVGSAQIGGMQHVQTAPAVLGTETSTPTPTRPYPTETPRPFVTPTHLGEFVISRAIDNSGHYARIDSFIPIPGWIKIESSEQEKVQEISDLYTQFGLSFNYDAYYRSPEELIATGENFLNTYPDSDGSIYVSMLLGNVRSLAEWDQPSELKTDDYKQAIQLLLKRHPERISYIVNDLIDMGMDIVQVRDVNSDVPPTKTLLFVFRYLDEPSGVGRSEIFTLVKRPAESWRLIPLALERYEHGDYATIQIDQIGDVNHDGVTDVLLSISDRFASHGDVFPFVFNLENEQWVDRLNWVKGDYGASNGRYWLEDTNRDGIKEIVATSSTSGEPIPWVDIYQWDAQTQSYSIQTHIQSQQSCGYHALAEADRHYLLKDYQGAIPWFQETRKRWLEEMKEPKPDCKIGLEADQENIDETFIQQIQVEDMISPTNRLEEAQVWLYYPALEDSAITQTNTITESVLMESHFANIYKCDTPACRVIARYLLSASYQDTLADKNQVRCDSKKDDYDDGYDLTHDASVLIQVSRWDCAVYDSSGKLSGEWHDIPIVNLCEWDTNRFVQKSYRIVDPTFKNDQYYPTYRQVTDVLPDLANLVDCSGDKP